MKFLGHELDNWSKHSDNWFRRGKEFDIGLRLRKRVEPLSDCLWYIDIVDDSVIKKGIETKVDILRHYRKLMLPDRDYKFHELEDAKVAIDNMIIRINNLKLFL